MNAMLSARGVDLTGCRVYVTLAPCNECAKAMAQAGIVEVIYYEDKHADQPIFIASKKIMDKVGIKYRQYKMSDIEVSIKI
jgi:dCMP deaminase